MEWDDFEDGLAIKFSGQYFKLNNDLCFIVPYFTPANSSRNCITSDSMGFEKLNELLSKYKSYKYDFLLLSDLLWHVVPILQLQVLQRASL